MILVLDFGSQYTQLIARRVREQHVYCEIHPFNVPLETVRELAPEGIILSGGPSSVYADGAPLPDAAILELGVPILGICYGMNVLNVLGGGTVARAVRREYGAARIVIDDASDLFADIAELVDNSTVWMSHGDRIESLAPGWKVIAHSANSPIAACSDVARRRWGIQFHPEVHHSEQGTVILRNFLFAICGAKPTWTMESFVAQEIAKIRARVGDRKVICALSGGVDSAVAAAIIDRAVGGALTCVFVDNGVLRAGEAERVAEVFRERFGDRLRAVDARKRFLDALAGVEDPEVKRKTIGRVFIEVFEAEAKKIPGVAWLAQGTLYPDVIESVSFKGPSATIKSHHNVGGLPERMQLELIEPLRELFKDEVRELGKLVDVSDEILQRQPFPGPGLAIRILGAVTEERLFILRAVDAIVVAEIKAAGLYHRTWQSFAVLLPVKTVGVMGDERTYENVIAIRAVESVDGMTADWARLPYDLLAHLSNRIINEVAGVNRVVYDISSKPPATIEWE
ncbi:MAG: GMP synthase (glutamine-hydrolyzing) [Polyangiaceae bacterium UTPRO1]|jgi:GMP synthase (glutamine-hydrolysing)|nr:glutamine-hydrolyzing GMP synthase [Myxococcales bacterium]OQY68919.1 MAG: GMP synthase (glutamine-hydrolyzing) [Polyangiaceae bacterium UTPRO1]